MPSALQEHLMQGLRKSLQRAQAEEACQAKDPPVPAVIQQSMPEPVQAPVEVLQTSYADMTLESRLASLSEPAREVLKALVRGGGFVNVSHLPVFSRGRKVPYATVRASITRLTELGIITSRYVGNFGMRKGMCYTLCDDLLSAKQIGEQPAPTIPQEQHPPTHPELILWADNGISEKQIERWEQEFAIPHELMTIYLKWCAWDAQHREIKSLANYFYSVLKKSGGYPKPEGYVSIEDKRLAELEQAKASAKEREAREIALRQEEADAGAASYFDQMMEKGEEDPAYAELRDSLPEFTKRMAGGPGDKVFRGAMWTAFRKKAGL